MTELIDFAKRRPVLTGIIAFALLALAVVAVFLGAKIWQAILGLFGVGLGAAQPLKAYAKKDLERVQSQTEIDAWEKKRLDALDQTKMKRETEIQIQQTKAHNEIDKAVDKGDVDELRARIIKVTRGPLQGLLWASLFFLSGCAHGVGSPGGVTRDVCFSKQEAGDILKRIADLQAAIKQCQAGAAHTKQVASVECQALVAKWQLEARVCSEKLVACSAKTCPTCWLPWLIAGVALTGATTLGIYATIRR